MPSSQIGDAQFYHLRGHWLRGCLRQMQGDPLGFYTKIQREHGDYVRLRVVLYFDCHVLTHPAAVEHVLHSAHKNYRKPNIFYNSVGLLVGDGLFTNEGESWQSQRRLVQPAFHTQYLARLCPNIVESAHAFVRAHENVDSAPIDISDAMMKLGLRIASTTLFSADISGEQDAMGKAFRIAFKHISSRMNSMQMIPRWLPTHSNRVFGQARRQLHDVVMSLITARRISQAVQPDDLLAMLLSARDEQTGHGMSDRLLMDEVLTLLTAGHENIGSALSWTWYLLAKHPAVQSELYDEIHGRLAGRPPAFDDVQHMPLLKAILEESMRLYPPGWGELRETIEADNICGYRVPAKSLILLSQWVTHRHPEFWEAPEEFRPQRFLPPASKTRHRFAYFPFGGGPRICIGMQLAMIEAALVIATILQHYRVELVANQQIIPDATFTLQPRHGVKVILHARS